MEEILPKLAQEKNDSARFYLGFSGLTISETNPVLDMHNIITRLKVRKVCSRQSLYISL